MGFHHVGPQPDGAGQVLKRRLVILFLIGNSSGERLGVGVVGVERQCFLDGLFGRGAIRRIAFDIGQCKVVIGQRIARAERNRGLEQWPGLFGLCLSHQNDGVDQVNLAPLRPARFNLRQ